MVGYATRCVGYTLISCQANFTALNIEPDDHSDDEVDNTKELQVGFEEAFCELSNA